MWFLNLSGRCGAVSKSVSQTPTETFHLLQCLVVREWEICGFQDTNICTRSCFVEDTVLPHYLPSVMVYTECYGRYSHSGDNDLAGTGSSL